MKRIFIFLVFFIISGVLSAQIKVAKNSNRTLKKVLKPVVVKAAYSDVSKPLREMKPIPGFYKFNKEGEHEEVPNFGLPLNSDNPFANSKNQNPNLQKKYSDSKASLILGTNVDGVEANDGYNVIPPDPYGDVGKTYYVQMVNNGTQIFNKSDGSTVLGPFDSSQFWDGFDGSWTGTNDGDPVVMYDEQADRWVVTQFAWDTDDGTNWELVAVSKTNDPTGEYYRYAFEFPDLPDYPKLGVFLDSYVLTVNSFSNSFEGTYVCALDRNEMLDGPDGQDDPAMIQFFDDVSNPSIASEFSFTWMPADIEGNSLPPAGTDIPFVFDMADETYWSKDALVIAVMHVDWNNPSNSTFTLDNEIAITQDTDPGDDAPQPSNPNEGLDLLNDRMMTRAQYRHFSDHESMVVARTVDDGNGVAAIRWYELRNTGSGWDIYQQSTYAPGDGIWRWMPAIAMNGNGDIAIAYATSDAVSVEPSMRAVARYASDPLNTMTTTETVLYGGNTSQDANTYTRWGDYFSLMVDPSDDYTFWFTGEYSDGGWDWVTRIIEFSLETVDPPSITSVTPTSLYEDRGKQITITGSDLTGCTFEIGGITGTIVNNDGSTAVIDFPPGNYSDGTLTVSNSSGNDTYSMTVSTRNTIPVVSGSGVTDDNHPTIQSALDGLAAWYGTASFGAGDLPGAKNIVVYAGTYTESVTLNNDLQPDATNTLTIENNTGDVVTVDATGQTNGFNLGTVDYVTLSGFTVTGADGDNIYAQGNNVTIQYNKTYGSTGGSGIKVETGTPFTISNNLSYGNFKYGIEDLSASNIVKNNTCDDNGGSYTPQNGVTIFNDVFTNGDNWTTDGTWAIYTGTSGSPSGDPVAGIEAGTGYLYSNVIDVTGYDNLTISNYYRSYGTNLNNQDDMAGAYSFDNSNWTTFYTASNDVTSWTQASVSGITPTSNTLYLRYFGDVDSDEYWMIDDVVVTGDQTGSTTNTGSGLYVGNVSATVENNIFVAKSGNDDYYALISPGNSISSSYNTYYNNGNTNTYDYNGTQDNTGPNGTGDLTGDPLFVGSGDYHLQSAGESYHGGEWPPVTANSGTWTVDGATSSSIDAGNPSDSYTFEPSDNGGRINQGTYGNTVQASKSAAAPSAINWTGSVDTDWQNTGNWDSGTIPVASDNVVIPGSLSNYPVIDDGISTIAVCNNLTIESGASVTIEPDGYMTINGSVTNNAGTSGLVINSDDTGTGSLIQNTSGGVDATVYRKLSSSARQWHMLSSPVDAAPLTVFTSSSYLFEYDESADDYWTGASFDTGSEDPWIAPSGSNMEVAKGYIYNYYDETLTFTGQLNDNTSTSSINITYTDNGGTAPNGEDYNDFDGWVLLGNPYTSAIDWDNAAVDHASANIEDAIYIYNDDSHNYATYAGGTSTNGGTQYIPAMQGFFVKANASGTLNIGSGALVHNSQTFVKNNNIQDNILRIKISKNGYGDETVVRFSEDATYLVDNGMDAYKLFTMDGNVPQIYTESPGYSADYSINTLPVLSYGSISIPLKLEQTDGDYIISVPEFNMDDMRVYLKDNLKSTLTEISLNDEITLTSDDSDKEDRFELVFEKSSTDVVLSESTYVKLYPNPNRGLFYLETGNKEANYEVTITNLTGQIIYEKEFHGNTKQNINLSNHNNGIYFVKIKFNDDSSVTKKIVIE